MIFVTPIMIVSVMLELTVHSAAAADMAQGDVAKANFTDRHLNEVKSSVNLAKIDITKDKMASAEVDLLNKIDSTKDKLGTAEVDLLNMSEEGNVHVDEDVQALAGCSRIVMYGTSTHSKIEGTYTRTTKGCVYNDYVYSGPQGVFMYHITHLSGSPIWSVGPTICNSSVYLAVVDAATYPEDISATWQEANDAGFQFNSNIYVKCSATSQLPGLTLMLMTTGFIFLSI